MALVLLAGSCARDTARPDLLPAEPDAGTWKTWVLSSADQLKVPPPPETGSAAYEADISEVRKLSKSLSPEEVAQIHRWNDYPAIGPWVTENMQLVSEQSKNPPLASRGYALVSVAIADAVAAAYHWKYVYNRSPPEIDDALVAQGADPSYPSEHAAMAGAASRILAYLFPERPAATYDAEAEEAAFSRVRAGVNYPSDVEAGLALGRAVADQVLDRASNDRADLHAFDPASRPPDALWRPPPDNRPDNLQAVEPSAGTWKTWLVDPAAVRPEPPPAYGSEQFIAESREVLEVTRNLTDEQKRIATFWAGGAGTPLPPGIWNGILLDEVRHLRLSLPRMARMFALMNVALSDAGVVAWDTKYAYWSPRPVNAIRDLGLDPAFKSFLPTPVFPSYISGHSTYSAAAAEVLAYLFPDRAERFHAMAEEAAVSRLYAGIHFRSDNEAGLKAGRKVGELVVGRALADGAGDTPEAQLVPSAAVPAEAATPAVHPPAHTEDSRSQPYWVPVATLSGEGNSESQTFTIAPGALQWKIEWECQATPFTVLPVEASGGPLTRKVADALYCPAKGQGFSAETGRLKLRVRSPGAWKATIEQQLDVPLVEPPSEAMQAAQVVKKAELHDVDRTTRGTATIYRLADGKLALRLDEFFVSRNADLEIRLSPLADPRTTEGIAGTPFKQIAPLRATVGSMNYTLPSDIDLGQFQSLIIWCEITRNAYGAGSFQ